MSCSIGLKTSNDGLGQEGNAPKNSELLKVSPHTTVKDTALEAGPFQVNAFQLSAFQVPRLVVELEDGSTADMLDAAAKGTSHWCGIVP